MFGLRVSGDVCPLHVLILRLLHMGRLTLKPLNPKLFMRSDKITLIPIIGIIQVFIIIFKYLLKCRGSTEAFCLHFDGFTFTNGQELCCNCYNNTKSM